MKIEFGESVHIHARVSTRYSCNGWFGIGKRTKVCLWILEIHRISISFYFFSVLNGIDKYIFCVKLLCAISRAPKKTTFTFTHIETKRNGITKEANILKDHKHTKHARHEHEFWMKQKKKTEGEKKLHHVFVLLWRGSVYRANAKDKLTTFESTMNKNFRFFFLIFFCE